jgi:hypothetical protein
MKTELIISALNLAQSLANETGIAHKLATHGDEIKVVRLSDGGNVLEIVRPINNFMKKAGDERERS